MKCSICDSEYNLRAVCPQRPGATPTTSGYTNDGPIAQYVSDTPHTTQAQSTLFAQAFGGLPGEGSGDGGVLGSAV